MTKDEAYTQGYREAFRVDFNESGMSNDSMRLRWEDGWKDAQRGLTADPRRPRIERYESELRAAGYDIYELRRMPNARQRAAIAEIEGAR